MANAEVLLSSVNTDTTSASVEVVVGRAVSFQAKSVGSAGSSAVTAQASLDGDIWSSVGAVSINGAITVLASTVPVKYVRATYETNGSSSPVTVVSLQSDEDG